jgi:hypothetical protein
MFSPTSGGAVNQNPDWVVLGAPAPDGRVTVWASRELNDAELRDEMDVPDIWDSWSLLRERGRRITLSVEMRTYTVVFADTYAEAFQILFGEWSPDVGRAEIAPPMRAIGHGAHLEA